MANGHLRFSLERNARPESAREEHTELILRDKSAWHSLCSILGQRGNRAMGRRVVVAVDLKAGSQAPVSYALQLAGRIGSSLVLVAIAPGESADWHETTRYLPRGRGAPALPWLDRLVAESQDHGVGLEVFVTSGRFVEEVMQFVRSQPGVQFIVLETPTETPSEDESAFAMSLKRLHQEFEGEILLVEKAGRITRVSEHYLKSSTRGTPE
jgi:hypothetical protein